jgi:hypothetical protein
MVRHRCVSTTEYRGVSGIGGTIAIGGHPMGSEKYDAFRKMMDEMMGEDRNMVEEEKANRRRHFSDPDIDKFFLCGLSPHS